MTHDMLVDNDARRRDHRDRAGLFSVTRLCRHGGWMDLTREGAVRREAISDLTSWPPGASFFW